MSARFAIINGQAVVNVVEYDDAPIGAPPGFPDGFLAVRSDVAGPGWGYVAGAFVDPNPAPVQQVPTRCSAGNFMRACVRLGWYSKINAFVDALPGMQGDELRALLKHAVEYQRHHPDLIAVARAVGMTDADIDAVFVLGNSL